MSVRALSIRTEPVYGPFDFGRSPGLFVIRFVGKIGAQDVQDGNMIVVIGPVMGAVSTGTLTDVPTRQLTVKAECFHVWRTQGDQIDDFPWVGILGIGPLSSRPTVPTERTSSCRFHKAIPPRGLFSLARLRVSVTSLWFQSHRQSPSISRMRRSRDGREQRSTMGSCR